VVAAAGSHAKAEAERERAAVLALPVPEPFELHDVEGNPRQPPRLLLPLPRTTIVFLPALSLEGRSCASNTISTKDLRGLMREFISKGLRRT
jgi:hypothetical protein